MKKEVVFSTELDADIDDLVAAIYLHEKGVLDCIVLDPMPKTKEGIDRLHMLEKIGISIKSDIPKDTKRVFVGGALTKVAKYIEHDSIECLVMNGGFVGTNIMPKDKELEKFRNMKTVRTFNFNCNIKAADTVLRSSTEQIKKIVLVGKNVCHSEQNTELGIWNQPDILKIFRTYNVKPTKKQHDMLACHEGLAMLGLGNVTVPFCNFLEVIPFNEKLDGNMTKWGSLLPIDKSLSPYRKVVAAITLNEQKGGY